MNKKIKDIVVVLLIICIRKEKDWDIVFFYKMGIYIVEMVERVYEVMIECYDFIFVE